MSLRLALLTCLFVLLSINSLDAQTPVARSVAAVNDMAALYNQKDFTRYVDYLLSSEYNGDTANKKGLAKMFARLTDTSHLVIVKLLKFKTVHGEKQVLFQHRLGGKPGYIVGVYNNTSKQWLFTQPLSQDVQFELVLNTVPSIDSSFAELMDRKFGKRINYNIGQIFPKFNYNDINGNLLSLDSLKGKVLVFNFWSITCAPCIKEIPQLNNLVKAMEGKDVVFIAPAFYSPYKYLVDQFLPKHPFAYHIVDITSPADHNMFTFPTHIVTDKHHNIVYKVANGKPGNIVQIESIVKKALDE